MDNSLTPEQQNMVIEEALHSYPIAPMPQEMTAQVMARIQAMPAPRPFRFTWRDVVLAVALSLCMGAIWFSLMNLPPLVMAQIRKESILFYQYLLVNEHWIIPVVSFSLAGFLSVLTLPYLKQELRKNSV